MQNKSIQITFPNGRVKTFPYTSFDYYAATNELEHNEENIIITLNDISHSFVYETDKLSDEITNKDSIIAQLIPSI